MTSPRLRVAAAALWIPLVYVIAMWSVTNLPADEVQRALSVMALIAAGVSLGGSEAGRMTRSQRPYVPVAYLGVALATVAALGYLVSVPFSGHDGWLTLAAPVAFSLLNAGIASRGAQREPLGAPQESTGLPSSSSRTP